METEKLPKHMHIYKLRHYKAGHYLMVNTDSGRAWKFAHNDEMSSIKQACDRLIKFKGGWVLTDGLLQELVSKRVVI